MKDGLLHLARKIVNRQRWKKDEEERNFSLQVLFDARNKVVVEKVDSLFSGQCADG